MVSFESSDTGSRHTGAGHALRMLCPTVQAEVAGLTRDCRRTVSNGPGPGEGSCVSVLVSGTVPVRWVRVGWTSSIGRSADVVSEGFRHSSSTRRNRSPATQAVTEAASEAAPRGVSPPSAPYFFHSRKRALSSWVQILETADTPCQRPLGQVKLRGRRRAARTFEYGLVIAPNAITGCRMGSTLRRCRASVAGQVVCAARIPPVGSLDIRWVLRTAAPDTARGTQHGRRAVRAVSAACVTSRHELADLKEKYAYRAGGSDIRLHGHR